MLTPHLPLALPASLTPNIPVKLIVLVKQHAINIKRFLDIYMQLQLAPNLLQCIIFYQKSSNLHSSCSNSAVRSS